MLDIVEKNENFRFQREKELYQEITRSLQDQGLAVKFIIVHKQE